MTSEQAEITTLEPATDGAADSATADKKPKHSDWRTGEDAHVVILRSGEGFFGIDINIVQEIVLMQEITTVPASAEHIAGITDLRGRVVPVAEFSALLGRPKNDQTDDTRVLVVEQGGGHIGLVVDAVTEVMMVGGDKIEDATTIGAQDHDFIVAVAKLEGNLIALVDIDNLLISAGSTSEARSAAAATAAANAAAAA
jgi:purine-binding chemotaxis protein CheW